MIMTMADTNDLNEILGLERYPLTQLQTRFAEAYASHRNGMKAVREAGYSHSTAGSQASAANRLLHLPKVQRAIEYFKSLGA